MQSVNLSIIEVDKLEKLITQVVIQAIDKKLHSASNHNKEELLTRSETAKMLEISLTTLHHYTIAGKIPAYRIGSRVRYKQKDIEQSLKLIKAKARL